MRNTLKTKPFSFLAVFTIIFFIFCSVFYTVTSIDQAIRKNNTIKSQKISSLNQLELQKSLFQSHFKTIRADLLFLSKTNEIKNYIKTNNEEDRILVEQEFFTFTSYNCCYDQVRYIDKDGMEIVRINANNGTPVIIPKDQLQDKSTRYYFREAVSLSENQIYISPFDLNIENEEIENPLKPMIRMGTPVFDDNRKLKGIIIINLLGQSIIDDLVSVTRTNHGTYSLLNQDGYWLYNNNPETEWGFMYPDKQSVSLKSMEPKLWEKIKNAESIQFTQNDNIYTATQIPVMMNKTGTNKNRYYFLLNTVTFSEIKIDKKTIRTNKLKFMVPAILISIVLSVFLSRIIVNLHRYRRELKELALYDQLTGLPNRKLFRERTEQTSAHAKRYNHAYAVFFIDLDGFKPVNDSLGHAAGDELLKQVGSRLAGAVRKTDIVARFGGDEFVILLPYIESDRDCVSVAEKILARLFREFSVSEKNVRIGASIGIAAVAAGTKADINEVLKIADSAMYDIKKAGKNSYKIAPA